MEGWRWIFVIEGSTSVVAGGFGYMCLYNYPNNSELLTEKDRKHIQNQVLASEGWLIEDESEDADNKPPTAQGDDILII